MSIFTPAEIDYLTSQRLGRLATTGKNGQPHVVPVSFRFNPEHDSLDIGGYNFLKRKKFRDVQENPRAALVVDDLVSVDPYQPRMIEMRGDVEIVSVGGQETLPGFDDTFFRLRPRRIVAWGIDEEGAAGGARSV